MARSRILIADDHEIVLEGLKSTLSSQFELVGAVKDGSALVKTAISLRPDIIITDVSMPEMDGIAALAELKLAKLSFRAVVLSADLKAETANSAILAGASAYVVKGGPLAELFLGIEAARSGGTYISPGIRAGKGPARRGSTKKSPISARQRIVLQQFAEGRSAKEIAAKLNVSQRTVEYHKYRLMECLQIKTSAELVQYAVTSGLVHYVNA